MITKYINIFIDSKTELDFTGYDSQHEAAEALFESGYDGAEGFEMPSTYVKTIIYKEGQSVLMEDLTEIVMEMSDEEEGWKEHCSPDPSKFGRI